MSSTKNTTLELLKLFASYMVVFIHVLFYGEFGEIIDALARFAVPLFFLVSGFFSYKITPEKIKKRIKHIASLLIFSTVLYTVANVTGALFVNGASGVIAYFRDWISPLNFIKLLAVNVPASSSHLWYLSAMIYVYAIYYYATVHSFNEKKLMIVSFSLLGIHIVLGEFLSVFGVAVPNIVVRNFALMGIPFFVLGLAAKKHENKIRNVPVCVAVIAALAGVAETVLSRHFFGKNELYIGSLLILFAMVTAFVKGSDVRYPPCLNSWTACSTYIYILHKVISSVIIIAYGLFGIDYASSVILINIHPLIVCVVSTVFAFVITKALNKKSVENKNRAKI